MNAKEGTYGHMSKRSKTIEIVVLKVVSAEPNIFRNLYYYVRDFCILIGLEQCYFSLIWNTYMWKLQTLCG